jgi:hypothetical protein
VFAVNEHLAEGHILCEESAENNGKSLKLQIVTRMPIVSSREGHNLKPL